MIIWFTTVVKYFRLSVGMVTESTAVNAAFWSWKEGGTKSYRMEPESTVSALVLLQQAYAALLQCKWRDSAVPAHKKSTHIRVS